jgi:ABC-type branched-subunit amino acid transport system permease subunit
MITPFDYLTVACFCGLVIAFFQFTDRDVRTLMQLLIPSLAFALGNQIGNAGMTSLGLALIAAGAGYTVLTVRKR